MLLFQPQITSLPFAPHRPEAEIFPPLERVLPSTAPLLCGLVAQKRKGFILVGGSEIMQNPILIHQQYEWFGKKIDNCDPKIGDSWRQVDSLDSNMEIKIDLCRGGETFIKFWGP